MAPQGSAHHTLEPADLDQGDLPAIVSSQTRSEQDDNRLYINFTISQSPYWEDKKVLVPSIRRTLADWVDMRKSKTDRGKADSKWKEKRGFDKDEEKMCYEIKHLIVASRRLCCTPQLCEFSGVVYHDCVSMSW